MLNLCPALQGEEQLSWRARATEAVGIIAAAIGVEPFRPHVQQVLASAFQVRAPLHAAGPLETAHACKGAATGQLAGMCLCLSGPEGAGCRH